jgi:hypothetical protein
MQKKAAPSMAGNERPVVNELDQNNNTTPGYFARYSSELNSNGWPIIPVKPGTKEPYPAEWQVYATKTLHQRTFNRWLDTCSGYSIGIVCGQVVAIDIDILDRDLADKLASLVRFAFGHTPLTRIGQAPKAIYVYRAKGPIPTQRLAIEGGKVEILSEGTQFVAYGIHPVTQRPYQWEEGGEPLETPITSLPEITAEDVEKFMQAVRTFYKVASPAGSNRGRNSGSQDILRNPVTGLVYEGREKHLTRIVLEVCRAAIGKTAEQIALEVWDEFQATADLARPKESSGRPYSMGDVRTKVRSTLRKVAKGDIKRAARSRFQRAPKQAPAIAPAEAAAFRTLIKSMVPRPLSYSTGRVALFMLDRLQDGQCSDTAEYIAKGAGVPLATAKKARHTLVATGLFDRARQLARVQSAPYWPNSSKVKQAVEEYGLSMGGVSKNIPNTIRDIPPVSGNDNDEAPLERSPLDNGHLKEGAPIAALLNPVEGPSNPTDNVIKEHSKKLALSIRAEPAQMTFTGMLDEKTPELEAVADAWVYEGGIIPETVIRVIRDQRKRSGMSQERMAHALGISRSQLANAEGQRFGLGREPAVRLRQLLAGEIRVA